MLSQPQGPYSIKVDSSIQRKGNMPTRARPSRQTETKPRRVCRSCLRVEDVSSSCQQQHVAVCACVCVVCDAF